MTTSQALKEGYEKLDKAGIESARIDTDLLLSFALKKGREFLLAHGEEKIKPAAAVKYKNLISRRARNEPVAYLIGEKEFYGLDFYVDKNTLIPRPETEIMVEKILALPLSEAEIIDIGTGSGCIAVSLVKNIKRSMPIYGLDISPQALATARKNARRHKVYKKITFLRSDLLNVVLKNDKFLADNRKLIIAANLPYLTPAQIKSSPSIKHEPKLALAAGPDGLKCYKKLLRQIKKIKNIRAITAFLEIDPLQTKKIKQLIKKELPGVEVDIVKDLGGYDRIVKIRATEIVSASHKPEEL